MQGRNQRRQKRTSRAAFGGPDGYRMCHAVASAGSMNRTGDHTAIKAAPLNSPRPPRAGLLLSRQLPTHVSLRRDARHLFLARPGELAQEVADPSGDAAQSAADLDPTLRGSHRPGTLTGEVPNLRGDAAHLAGKPERAPRTRHQDDGEHDDKELPEPDVSYHLRPTPEWPELLWQPYACPGPGCSRHC